MSNKGLIFKAVPSGWPVAGQDLAVESRPFDPNAEPPAGGLVTENLYFSFDPYQRGRMRDASVKSYTPAYALGAPMQNFAIARVHASDHGDFARGDVVAAMLPIEEYSVLPASSPLLKMVQKIDNKYKLDPKLFLGPLGMPGLTAFSSFYDIGQPKRGESILVSAASGAVGQLVGQLAKHEGLTVYGSVGDDAKLDFIQRELGFDGGFNYKRERPAEALKRLAPDGIDIYYDNVGGEQLDAALAAMKDFGRIICCGMISQYNLKPSEAYAYRNLGVMVPKRLTMRGFIQSDANMGPRYTKDHQEKLQAWLHDGTFKSKISTTVGIDHAVDGFLGMLKGDNFGKAVLVVKELQ